MQFDNNRAVKGISMRFAFAVLSVLALSACEPTVPDSGVGFDNYPDYVRSREAALNTGEPLATIAGPAVSTQPLGATAVEQDALPAGIARETGEILAATAPSGAISDEQEFSAVSARESIESDAERIARNRAQYEVIAPTALPERDGTTGPNIVEFAISTRNSVGEQIYGRTNPFREAQAQRNCAKYPSSDLAQEDFLIRGGPERDSKSLDPDGDGFACAWDPTPFRNAVR